MKRLFLKSLGTVSLLLFTLTTNATSVEKITVSEKAPHFRIILPANPTTGYRWQLKDYDKSTIQLMDSQYVPSKKDLIGASGLMVFTFQPSVEKHYPQQTKLTFEYARPWEKNQIGKKQEVVVFFKKM